MKYNEIINSIIEENSYRINGFGAKIWKNSKGQTHRDNDKPAVICADGSKYWYQNGGFHRDDDKPAIMLSNGLKEWWLNDKFIKQVNQYEL